MKTHTDEQCKDQVSKNKQHHAAPTQPPVMAPDKSAVTFTVAD